jgi:MoaA/NifB/PqqE/SkfB family radical SAM enzyme
MYRWSDIRRIHLEMTTKCNASCPQCPRNIDGGPVNPNLPITELRLVDIQRIFPVGALDKVRVIQMCGNYGDASLARELVEVCGYINAVARGTQIQLHSNGSARNPEWWASLARLVHTCVFAIDGLEDTNHVYRRNTVWSRIMANAEAFIAAGGRASWNFIVFEHNEHQVDAAAEMAQKMGFRKFYAKRTGRFLKDNILLPASAIRNVKGDVISLLKPPVDPVFRNPEARHISNTYSTEGAFKAFMGSTPISCKAEKDAQIYISAEGFVFPCCWMAQIYPQAGVSTRKRQILDMIGRLPGGRDAIDARKRSLAAILNDQMFQEHIPNGWKSGEHRLNVCSKFCGQHKVSNVQKMRAF